MFAPTQTEYDKLLNIAKSVSKNAYEDIVHDCILHCNSFDHARKRLPFEKQKYFSVSERDYTLGIFSHVCAECGEEQPANNFRIRRRGSKVYICGQCKPCINKYWRKYYAANPEFREKSKKRSAAWKRTPKGRAYVKSLNDLIKKQSKKPRSEKRIQYQREYQRTHKGGVKERAARYYLKNKDKILQRRKSPKNQRETKLYFQKYREKNREKLNEYRRNYDKKKRDGK